MNLQQWHKRLQAKFLVHGIDQPQNTCLLLLAAVLDQDKSWILAHSEYQPTLLETKKIEKLSNQVANGRPLPYVLGHWEFFGRRFKVSPDVLIPRPETESLVELALVHAQKFNTPKIVDVGTGSGAIAISLAADLPDSKIVASDISRAALHIAQENAQMLGHPQILFLQTNLLAPFEAKFDLICANLPYIPTGKLMDLAVARWEPHAALDGGESGLEFITTLLKQSRERLKDNGVILLEIESSLGAASLLAAEAALPAARIRLIQDLAGRDRIIEIKRV